MRRYYYYRWIIVDGDGAEVSRDYKTRKDAQFDLETAYNQYGIFTIKKRRYYYS